MKAARHGLLTALVAALWGVLLLGGAFRPRGYDLSGPPRPDVGYPAPDLEVVGPDLAPIRLADLKGQAVFLNFWASWCGPCRMEMPEIQRLYESLPAGTAILAVNMTAQESGPEEPRRYLVENGYTFPVALDPSGRAGESYRILSLPTSLFISPDGIVTARIAGPLTQRAMAEYLAEAAAARPVAPGQGGLLGGEGLRRLSPGAHLPEVLSLGPAVLSTQMLFWLAGAALAYLLAGHWARRAGLEAGPAQDLVLNLALGSALGAKLIYVLLDPAAYLGSPRLLLALPYGDLAPVGALLGGVALAGWGLRKQKGRLSVLDQAAPALVLGAALGAAGWAGPGGGALFLCLLAAGLATAYLRATGAGAPGHLTAAALSLVGLAAALADLARPASGPGGMTGVQGVATLLATAAWYWQRRAPGHPGPGAH